MRCDFGLGRCVRDNQVSIRHATTEVHALRNLLLRNAACPRALHPAHLLQWEIATASDLPPHWLRFTSSCLLCCRMLCCSLHQPQVPAPTHPSAKETTHSKGNPSHSPCPAKWGLTGAPSLLPSLPPSSAHVPPPLRSTPSVRDRRIGSHPTGRPPSRSLCRRFGCKECTLSAPRDTATATVAVSGGDCAADEDVEKALSTQLFTLCFFLRRSIAVACTQETNAPLPSL